MAEPGINWNLTPINSPINSLVIAPQWIGDAVMTEPLLRRLHARGEHLTIAALPWVAPVYQAMAHVAEVIELPFPRGGLQWGARRKLARELRGRYDTAYVLPNSWKSALIPWMAGIPARIGYVGEARYGLLTQRLINPPKGQRPPMVAFYSALSGAADVTQDRPRLQLDPAQIAVTLATWGLQAGQYDIYVPGSEYGPAKRWPAAHFGALAQSSRRKVVLLGSGKEAALCEEIVTRVPVAQRPSNLAGRTSLMEAFALIAGAHKVLSNDTGLMHVAAALQVPQVALFGSSSPLHTPPLSDSAQVLWLKNDPSYTPPLDCAPCYARVCPLGHTRCLQELTPERVQQFL